MVVDAVIIFFAFLLVLILVGWFCLFFDNAILTRRGTVYQVPQNKNKIAITFDDGPSPVWTPLLLDELKKLGVKGTFFVIGHHVKSYPDVARRIVEEGHLIGNHGYAHSVILYYTLPEIEEIKYTEQVIKDVTGVTTSYYRPPKAWLLPRLKNKIKSLDYTIVLWSINSKDWTPLFTGKDWVNQVVGKIKSGDIILFHDSGNVFSAEGGDRSETVKAVSALVETLRKKGFEFVTVEQLLKLEG